MRWQETLSHPLFPFCHPQHARVLALNLLPHNYITRWLPDPDIILAFKDRIKGKDTRAKISPELPSLPPATFYQICHTDTLGWKNGWETISFFPTLQAGVSRTVGFKVTLYSQAKSLSLLAAFTFTQQFFWHFCLLLWLLPKTVIEHLYFSILSEKSRYNNT